MSIKAQPETLRDRVISRSGTPMAEAKAVCFVMAAFVLLAPLMLAAQVPAPGASKADSTLPQAPTVAETNESAELAQKLTNPLAKLISIPIQNWFDFNLGPKKDGFRYTMEAQPVYPVQISKNWNLLSRTTIPIVGTLALYFYKYKKINWLLLREEPTIDSSAIKIPPQLTFGFIRKKSSAPAARGWHNSERLCA